MEGKVPEHLNMDSAAGNMPPPPVPEKLKQKLPKGELNPYTKHTGAPHHSEKVQRKHQSGAEMESDQLKGNWAKSINMFSAGPEKQAIIAEKALEEVTKVSEEELQKRDKQIFQTWIQQNPVQAALLGIDKDDPFEEKKGKSPAKYYKNSPLKRVYGTAPVQGVQHMGRQQAFNYGQQANKDWATEAGVAGGQILQEKLNQWDQERQQYFAKLKAQKDREAKELLEVSKPLVQTLDQSAALDESTKNLLAQQWKQGFVENEKKYKAGEIDQYEYSLNKAQSLSNAQQYQSAVGNLTEASQRYAQMIKDGTASDAMTEEARDFYTSLASGKGMNITATQDGKKVANNGLSIQNVNGQPTMVGWTAGQIDQARQAYQQLQQPDPVTGQPKITAQNTSFEAFLGSVPRPGDPTYEQQKQDPLYAQWIDGVNIPVANLASGEGMPEMLEKDTAFNDNITEYANDIAQKAINNQAYPQPTSTEGLWDQAEDYSKEYVSQMMSRMPEQAVRSIAADYLDMTPNDIRKVLDQEGGLEALKKQMEPEMLEAIKLKFEADPSIAAINKEWRDRTNAMAKQTNAANLRGTGSGASAKQEAIDAQATQISNSNDLSTFTGMKFGNDLYEEIKKVDDHRSLWEKVAPTSMGGQQAPTEQMYEVRLKDGKKVPMTESQLRQKLFTSLGVRAGESAPQETQTPTLNEAQASEVDSIMADLGYGTSPNTYRSPLSNKKVYGEKKETVGEWEPDPDNPGRMRRVIKTSQDWTQEGQGKSYAEAGVDPEAAKAYWAANPEEYERYKQSKLKGVEEDERVEYKDVPQEPVAPEEPAAPIEPEIPAEPEPQNMDFRIERSSKHGGTRGSHGASYQDFKNMTPEQLASAEKRVANANALNDERNLKTHESLIKQRGWDPNNLNPKQKAWLDKKVAEYAKIHANNQVRLKK